jgi:hypothetical protein
MKPQNEMKTAPIPPNLIREDVNVSLPTGDE